MGIRSFLFGDKTVHNRSDFPVYEAPNSKAETRERKAVKQSESGPSTSSCKPKGGPGC